MKGIGSAAGSYLVGGVYDWTKSFRTSFIVVAVFLIAAQICDSLFFKGASMWMSVAKCKKLFD